MLRTVLVYGAIAGLITITSIAIGFQMAGGKVAESSQLTGYLIMIAAMSLIFVGVKRYRDQSLGGVIRFWPAFRLGLGIAAMAGLVYVLGWEAYLQVTDLDFMRAYADMMQQKYIADGLAGEALQAKLDKMQAAMELYKNWWFRMPLTFLEIFPVGLIVALISAALLRNPAMFPSEK